MEKGPRASALHVPSLVLAVDMLEHDRLEILAWTGTEGEPSAQPVRRILNQDTGMALGAVRFEGTATDSRWTWTRPPRLVVMEAEDDGLCHMATLRRTWLSAKRWKVFDAEDQIVGVIHGLRIQDPLGYRFAWAEPANDAAWRFRDCTGREYGLWTASNGCDRLEWCEPRVTNPFLRMLVLAAVLCRIPIPHAPVRA